MSARPRAGMRIPAGTTPTDASVPKEDADRLKAKEDEEFEKFLNDVADGEAKLKAREDAERQRDWQETQDYLKKQKDVRTGKAAALATSPQGGSFRSDARLAMLGPAPLPPSTSEQVPLSAAARAASPPAVHRQPARSPLSPERVRVAGGDQGRDAGATPTSFKSPPRGLMANPVAPAASKKIEDFGLKSYPPKQIVLLQALARRWLVLNGKRKKAGKMRDHRRNCAKELLETELQYVKALETVIQVYLEPLQFHYKLHSASTQDTDKPYLSQEQLQTLFSNIVPIFQFNQKFCSELAAKVSTWSEETRLGDLFIKWGPFFKIYITYCNNHEKAAHLYLETRDEPRFAAWLETCRLMADPLDSYLIRPVQRIPRYILLLTDIIKHTPKTHPDYNDLVAAVSQTQTIADNINVAIKQSEKMNQVLTLQEKLGIKDLVEPSRSFIRTGLLQVCQLDQNSLFKKDIVSYWFFLFNDLLLWAERKGESYQYKSRLPLSSTRLKDVPDNAVIQNVFHVIGLNRTITLAAPTRKDKKDWMDSINAAILGLREITARRGEAVAADAPYLSATIIATEQRKEDKGNKTYTAYVIEVKKADGTTEWLERRYSDFDFLHKEIEKKFPSYNFTKLPQKHLFGNLKKDIVQGRQVMLETYLQELLAKPDVCKSDMFVRFLSSGAEKRIVSHIKVYDREDENVSWTISVNQYTTCRDILRSVARKLNIDATTLALFELLPQGAENRVPEDDLMQPLKQRLEAHDVGQRLCVVHLTPSPSIEQFASPVAERSVSPRPQSPPGDAGRPAASSLTSPRLRAEMLSPRLRGASATQVPGVIPPEMSGRPLPASPLTLERRDSSSGIARPAGESPIVVRRAPPLSPRPTAVSPLSQSSTATANPPLLHAASAPSLTSQLDPPRSDRAISPSPLPPLRGRAAVVNLGEVHPEPARKPLPIPPGRLHNFPSLPPPALPPPPPPPPAPEN